MAEILRRQNLRTFLAKFLPASQLDGSLCYVREFLLIFLHWFPLNLFIYCCSTWDAFYNTTPTSNYTT